MAEIFGIVAGAFGACSLALELLEVTKSAQRYWRRIHDLPFISSEISDSLGNIERLLTVIRTLAIQEPRDHDVIACLERCRPSLERVKDIIQNVEASGTSRRLRNIKHALKRTALEEQLSVARASLRETINDLSLALLVSQLQTTCQQSLVLYNMERRLAELRREDAVIEIGAKSEWRDDMGSLEGISSPVNSQGIIPRNDRLGSSCYCRFETAETLGVQSGQPDFNQSDHGISERSLRQRTHHEVYQIRSQHFNLFLGMLSVSILRKNNKAIDSRKRRENSETEIKLRFAPSWFICKAFMARLYASTTGGLNLSQNLVTVQIVPRYEGIFLDVCSGEITTVRKTFEERKASPNSADKYGHSLLAMAAGNGYLELVRYFLDLGVNTQIVDDNGRNPLQYVCYLRGSPLDKNDWEILRLLVEKCQIDPWTPDFTGQNLWHTFCQTCQPSTDFPWRSMATEFLPILDDQDCFGRTALFLMSSNAKASLDIFQWHLQSGASLSVSTNGRFPQWDGLTCLHAAIASLQPRNPRSKFEVIDVDLAEILAHVSPIWKSRWPSYNEDDRVNQMKRIELLIQHGADLFAVSELYGTPTDVARFTGNFDIWIDSLKNCGITPKRVLATDKKIERSKKFWVTELLVREQKCEKRKLHQHFNDIFGVLDDFQFSENAHGIKSRAFRGLPANPLLLKMKPYREVLHILRSSLFNTIHVDEDDQKDGTRISADVEFFGGAYLANFFGHICYNEISKNILLYKKLHRYLEMVAAIASADADFEELEWKSNHNKYYPFLKAMAAFYLDKAFRFPPRGYDWRYVDDATEVEPNIPGSWPAG